MGRILLLQRNTVFLLMAGVLHVRGIAPAHALDGVDVYYNLHKLTWSCRGRKSGLVEHHAPVIVGAFGAGFIVRESGRLRVLKEKRKNVHAFARFDQALASDDVEGWAAWAKRQKGLIEISYNPYRAGEFYRRDTWAGVHTVSSLTMLAPPGQKPRILATLE